MRTQRIATFDTIASLSSPFALSSSITHSRHRGHPHARHHALHGHLAHAPVHHHQGLPKSVEDQPF